MAELFWDGNTFQVPRQRCDFLKRLKFLPTHRWCSPSAAARGAACLWARSKLSARL